MSHGDHTSPRQRTALPAHGSATRRYVVQVPFVDLRAQYLTIKREVDAAIESVIDTTAFVGGEQVSAFEAEFAAYCADVDPNRDVAPELFCVGCANGTDAIIL